jgi:type I restriction enzyme S subunit
MRKDRVSIRVDWATYRLNQVAARITRRNFIGNTNVLTVSARDGLIGQEEFFRRRVASSDTRQYFLLEPGDFVYSKSYSEGYPIGAVKSLKGPVPGIVSPLYICFRPDSTVVNERFLEYYFDSGMADGEIEWIAKEGSRNHGLLNVGIDDFMSIQLRLPPIEEQRRITEIIGALDQLILASKMICAKLDATLSALIAERLAATVKQVKIILPLDEAAEVSSGVTLGSEPDGFGSVELPYLRVANVQDGYFDTADMKTVRILRSELPRYLLRKGDVLLTEGGDLDKLGRGAMWDGRIPECLCQNHIFRVRCDRTKMLPEYLSLYIGSLIGKAYFLKIAKQTTNLATINSTQLKAMPLPIPSIDDQVALVEILACSTAHLDAERRKLSKLGMLKQGLMDDLLTGQVRVANGEMEHVRTG